MATKKKAKKDGTHSNGPRGGKKKAAKKSAKKR
jgi:hypothetical protein